MFYGKVARLDGKLQLRRELVFLIREQVARINICLFCMDIGRWAAIEELVRPQWRKQSPDGDQSGRCILPSSHPMPSATIALV